MSLVGPKILQYHQGMTQCASLLKTFPFSKVKKQYSFNPLSIEVIKRITNDPDIKKSGEIPTYFFKKCGFVMDTVTVCVNEALETRFFPNSLKCVNVRPIYKKVDPFDKNR